MTESIQTGYIQELIASNGDVVQYALTLDSQRIPLNDWVGHSIEIAPTGELACVFCGRPVKKLFANGSCYPCFRDLPQNDLCIVKPYLCHYDTCRDQSWGDHNCMIPTYLYIAASSGIKVGISRNLPGRWLDQGAVRAMPLARLTNRKLAGELELHLSQFMPDKTNWRKMLRGEVDPTPLAAVADEVRRQVPPAYRPFLLDELVEQTFTFPGQPAPGKLTSHNLDKGALHGRLVGIRGQYLILTPGADPGAEPAAVVLNMARHAGYQVQVTGPGAGAAGVAATA